MSPSRSTNVTIQNETSHSLILSKSVLSHGEWTEGLLPLDRIPAGESGVFQAESAGFMTGDEGFVIYTIGSSGETITLNFDNPFTGSNSYYEDIPSSYVAHRNGGGGDNAYVTWKIVQA